jgi:site-specific DNA recombinase
MKNAPSAKSKAVIYARVSSKEQEREGFSIPAQLKSLREYAQNNDILVIQEFVDIETAGYAGRRSFGNMIEFLQELEAQIILVEKTDRLYRNIKDWVLLDGLNVEIHLVKEGRVVGPDSRSQDKFIHGIWVLMAKNYLENLSEEVKKGMHEKARQGYYPSRAPMGYRNVQREGRRYIEQNPEEALVIKRLFESYATGEYSLQELTDMANVEGLAYRWRGKKVHKSIIHYTLRNPIYYGDFVWKDKLWHGKHEPIVSKSLWDRVQTVLVEQGHCKKHDSKRHWAFQGMIRCGHCGCLMTAEIQKGKYVYYHCTGNRGKCPEPWVREEEIAKQFSESLQGLHLDLQTAGWIKGLLRHHLEDEQGHHERMIKVLEVRYNKLQDKISRSYDNMLDGRISEELFDQKNAEWQDEQAKVLEQIRLHQDSSRNFLDEFDDLIELARRAVELYEKQEMSGKRRLLQFVCSNSTYKDGKLRIVYRKPFDLLIDTKQALLEAEPANYDEILNNEHWVGPVGFEPTTYGL